MHMHVLAAGWRLHSVFEAITGRTQGKRLCTDTATGSTAEVPADVEHAYGTAERPAAVIVEAVVEQPEDAQVVNAEARLE